MQIAYLDQNKWIDLARVAHEKIKDDELADVLTFLRAARKMRLACIPLSQAHYMETHKHSNAERRARLAAVMMDISGGASIAGPDAILRHELDVSLGRRFPHRAPPGAVAPFELLGLGI